MTFSDTESRSILRRAGASVREEGSVGLLRMLTPADYVTLTNAVCGLAAIFLIGLNQIELGVLLIFAAILGDGLDGLVARSGYGNGPFGAKLDSFADFLNFCVAPAVLLYHTYYQWEIITQLRGPNVLTSIAVATIAGALVVFGMLRLVRFEVLKGNENNDFFVGLPTPAASIPITLAAFLGWSPQAALPLTLVIALLMVSRVRFPKIRGVLILPAVVALLATIFLRDQYGDLIPQLLFYGMVAYMTAGPLLVWWREEDGAEAEPPLAS